MYAAATHFFATRISNVLRNQAMVGVSNLFASLFLSNPTKTGQAGVEANYPGYARQPISFTPPSANAEGDVSIQNTSELLWQAPASNAGVVTFVAIHDSATGGNMLFIAELNIPLELVSGMPPSLDAGDIICEAVHRQFSVWFKSGILNTLRGQNFEGLNPHIGIYTGDPEAGGIELSGGGYERPPIIFTAPSEQPGGQMRMANDTEVRFPRPTAFQGEWRFTALLTAQNAGNVIWRLGRQPNVTIQRNHTPVFRLGEFVVNVS